MDGESASGIRRYPSRLKSWSCCVVRPITCVFKVGEGSEGAIKRKGQLDDHP